MVCSTTQAFKVDVPNSNTKIIWINIFEWYMVRSGSKNGHQNTYVQKRLDYMLNSQNDWGDPYDHIHND